MAVRAQEEGVGREERRKLRAWEGKNYAMLKCKNAHIINTFILSVVKVLRQPPPHFPSPIKRGGDMSEHKGMFSNDKLGKRPFKSEQRHYI